MPEDTKHSAIDPEAVLKRTATRQAAHEHELDFEIKPAIMRLEVVVADIPIIKEMLVVALRPRAIHPFVQGTVAVAAVFWTLFLGSIAYTLVHATPARASVTPTSAETARR